MKKSIIALSIALSLACSIIAQTVEEKPKVITESMLILPKRGMEEKFEAAVKAHNAKFHGAGPNVAGLRKVEYGEKANWYVWVHGPTTYASLDNPPSKESGHEADWTTNVEPLIDTYGETQLWERNDDLSFGTDFFQKSKYYELWSIKLKSGESKRFHAICEKLKKTYESIGTQSFLVLESTLHQAHGADVELIWGFNSYGQWENDPGPKVPFEKIYGAGSWQALMDEWNAVKVDYNSEIRSFVR